MVRRRGAEVGSEIASWQVRTSARLRWVIYSFLAWRGERAAEPGRCQRGGSNDDLYPLLPVLLPTRDNTNHYHRLITGITANIEIMRACVCARARRRMCARTCFDSAADPLLPPRGGCCPPLPCISSSPPTLSFSFSPSFILADSPMRGIQRRCGHHPRDAGRGGVRVVKSGANQCRTKRSVRRR